MERLPTPARDIGLNLAATLKGGSLGPDLRWGVAVAAASASRHPDLLAAVVAAARAELAPGQAPDAPLAPALDDALAAAALMAQNNVYYQFRDLVGRAAYQDLPARLRMQRLARPATRRVDFELFCLVVSAINGCEACVQAHEHEVVTGHEGGLTEEQVNDAVRLAATVQAMAVGLEMGAALARDDPGRPGTPRDTAGGVG